MQEISDGIVCTMSPSENTSYIPGGLFRSKYASRWHNWQSYFRCQLILRNYLYVCCSLL